MFYLGVSLPQEITSARAAGRFHHDIKERLSPRRIIEGAGREAGPPRNELRRCHPQAGVIDLEAVVVAQQFPDG